MGSADKTLITRTRKFWRRLGWAKIYLLWTPKVGFHWRN